jgi:hypothetical protein
MEQLFDIKYLQENKVKTAEYLYGIYFLMDGEELVYIGSTTKGEHRIGQHRFKKQFTHYLFQEIKFENSLMDAEKIEQLLFLESRLISFYRPKYNKSLPVTKFKSVESIKNLTRIDKRTMRGLFLRHRTPYEFIDGRVFYDYEHFVKTLDPQILKDAKTKYDCRVNSREGLYHLIHESLLKLSWPEFDKAVKKAEEFSLSINDGDYFYNLCLDNKVEEVMAIIGERN